MFGAGTRNRQFTFSSGQGADLCSISPLICTNISSRGHLHLRHWHLRHRLRRSTRFLRISVAKTGPKARRHVVQIGRDLSPREVAGATIHVEELCQDQQKCRWQCQGMSLPSD
jgi:hypothetical protein